MFNIVEKRSFYFIGSGIAITLGILMMIYSSVTTGGPFQLSIDFVGGSIYDFQFIEEGATEEVIRDVFAEYGEDNVVVQQLGGNAAEFRVVIPAENDPNAVLVATQSLGETVTTEILGEAIYSFSVDTNDVDELRNDFIDAGIENAFVLQVEDGFTAVIPATDISNVEVFFDEIGAEYERLEGQVVETRIETDTIDIQTVNDALAANEVETLLVQRKPYRWSIRGGFEDQATNDAILSSLDEVAELDRSSLRIETVSETVGREVTQAAFVAVGMAAVVITGFIVLAFRQIPKATRYGICAIAAMIHDVLIVMGIMSFMGVIAGWEIDALFLTAVLTVVGFSVQDSIVVFDRIRENIPKHIGEPYETIVNRSIWETIHRSLATQLNAFFVMIAILLFGGETIKEFIAILLLGLLSGTYSSIFIAVPLLVSWEKGEIPLLEGDEALSGSEQPA